MKKNIQSLLRRDLEVIPLIAYFIFYFLYLFFDRVLEMKDYALLVKPLIIPIIAFLYVTNKNSKRNLISILLLLLLLLIFISDNSTLLEMRTLYVYATMIYMFSVFILLYYALLDNKFINSNKFFKRNLVYVLLGVIITTLLYWFSFYNPKEKAGEKFMVFEYMIVFLLLFLISTFNFIQQKSKQTKYFFLALLSLFLSELCFSIHHYYNGHVAFKFLIFIVEVPVYYFLLKYLLKREKNIIEQ
ncbi:hypothetical protein [Flavobacterium facile]|uniref:hypothetical protein n=1 Tax=Flavobacterium facile TaxID=2893174 RepID=UPI002E78D2A9|nr:hypothetical protein [Flavobacterium sp. T-12]